PPVILHGNGTSAPFSITRVLTAGDTVDFAVGIGTSGFHQNDSTGLKVTIAGSVTGGSGTINVTTDLQLSSFTITGPTTYTGGGKSFTQTNAPAGTYTVTFDTVFGYSTPNTQTFTLSPGGQITFSGTYTLLGVGTITVSTNIPKTSFSISPGA